MGVCPSGRGDVAEDAPEADEEEEGGGDDEGDAAEAAVAELGAATAGRRDDEHLRELFLRDGLVGVFAFGFSAPGHMVAASLDSRAAVLAPS